MDTRRKRSILIFIDAVCVVTALVASFLIQFDGRIPQMYLDPFYSLFLLFLIVKIPVFYIVGLYNRIWRYASIDDLFNITKGVTAGSILLMAIAYINHLRIPRSVMVMDFMFTLLFVGAVRLLLRLRHEYLVIRERLEGPTKRVLIMGAGDAGELIIREMIKHPELGYIPVGIVDDDRDKQNMKIHGIPVMGNRRDIAELVKKYDIDEVIIAIPSASGKTMRAIVEKCKSAKVRFKTVPGVFDLIGGNVSVSQIRDVAIEDLLGREQVNIDLEHVAHYISGKRILITGAGGSIGSQLAREIAVFKPAKLILMGRGEFPIYSLGIEFDRVFPHIDKALVIGSVTDEDKLSSVFAEYKPQVVFHAAAHKHVPLMEAHPDEAVKNNILGTYRLAKMSHENNVEVFVLISTDKAVNPTNVMGATKRIAEMIVQSFSLHSKTRFVSVRFGNVLGSRGSVIPLFKEQIKNGGPVTVTHPEIVRYFMTIPEAAKLVLQAGSMARGGEIFILDMGEPVKIIDLARDMIRLSGFEPDVDIPIKITGLRPGEKIFEELLTAEEGTTATCHRKIFIAKRQVIDPLKLEADVNILADLARRGNIQGIISKLVEIIPTYRPDGDKHLSNCEFGKERDGAQVSGQQVAGAAGESRVVSFEKTREQRSKEKLSR